MNYRFHFEHRTNGLTFATVYDGEAIAGSFSMDDQAGRHAAESLAAGGFAVTEDDHQATPPATPHSEDI